MVRLTYIWEVSSSSLLKVFILISVIAVKTTKTQLSFSPTACARTTDLQTVVDITSVAYAHRFQVTSVLQKYQFIKELSDIDSVAFQDLANKYETEVVNELIYYESDNKYDAVVFLFLPNGGTTQIEAVVNAQDTKLQAIDMNEVMRRVSVRTNITELQNMDTAPVQEEVQYCLHETIIPPNGTLTWPSTPIGTEINTVELCPQGTQFAGQVALATRQCLQTGCIKYKDSDKRVCHGAWQSYHCNECFNMSVNPLLQQLSNMHLTCVTQLIGNILLLSDDTIAAAEESIKSASILLEVLDNLLLSTVLTDDNMLSVVTPSMALGLVDVDVMTTNNQWYGFGSYMNDGILTNSFTEVDISPQLDWSGAKDTFIYVLVDEQESSVTRAVYTLHQNDKFYQTPNTPGTNDVIQLNSRIISAMTHNVISQPTVYAAFKMIDALGVNQTCVFWVPSTDGGVFGDWSLQGCTIEYVTSDGPEGLTICKCNHFGSFALLANIQDISPTSPNTRSPPLPMGAFVIFAVIFCFLAFTAVAMVFALVSALRMQRELQILTFLFFDLAIFYLIFGIAINRTTPKNGCVFAAAVMYLCLVSAFAWMAVSAGNSYEYSRQKYIQLKWFVRKAAILAFGIPMGLAVILAVTNPFYFFDTQYMCFLSGDPTYIMGAALLLPLAISILVTIVLFIASFIIYPELEELNPELPTPRLQRLITRKRRLYMSAILFGLIFITFVFLLLAIYLSSVATQVIFGLVAIVQAIFVLWVYCYYDKEIRRAVVEAIRNTKPTEHGRFQPYWSSAKWQQPSPEIPEQVNQPTVNRFLDAMNKPASLTPQTFNPDSIPLTDLEKKRLKITVNGDVVRDAKLVKNKRADMMPVITGFSTQVVMEVNGNGIINPGMIIPEPDYSDEEDEANGFVRAEEIDLTVEEDTAF
ncbi:uncharacterized protein [Amphiura filiformis]|uniref:uncharacterized protein n=1 Tax=Amphiura filiformis TaxID=82378 RepID=UPI003B21B795